MADKDGPNTDGTADEDLKDLKDTSGNAQEILVTAESIFPFNLFPDTITVSRMKVSVAKRVFFRVAESNSMQIEDILNIEVNVGPFFGSLTIYTRIMGIDPLRITFLSRNTAVKVKQILEGYIIAKNQGLDTSSIERDELIKRLREMGGEKTVDS